MTPGGGAGSTASPRFDLRGATLGAFATPVANLRLDEMLAVNPQLEALILAAAAAQPGVTKSNVGGWHSTLDFASRDQLPVRSLFSRIQHVLRDLTQAVLRPGVRIEDVELDIVAWANVLRFGEYNSLHSHPNAFWSGVYYVNGNEPVDAHPFSGRLELIDPRPGASLTYAELTNLYGRFMINPQPAQIVIFPAWLQHQVHPYFGRGTRISVAFNATLRGLPGTPHESPR